jgi:hypothetical protein
MDFTQTLVMVACVSFFGVAATAQIDPSIPLRVNPPQQFDVIDAMRRAQEIARIRSEIELNRQAAERIALENQQLKQRQTQPRVAIPPPPPVRVPENASNIKTSGLYNGRIRKTLDESVKLLWLEVAVNGVLYATAATNTMDKIKTILPGLTYQETSQALDSFYATPENANIPVVFALQIVTMKAGGVDQDTVTKQTNELRALALNAQ